MATAKAYFDRRGGLLALYQGEEIARYEPSLQFERALEFDPLTNEGIIEGVRRDWNGWSYDGRDLRRRGELVPVNPPGERKQLKDSAAADLAALRANGWDGLAPPQRTRIILRLIVADGVRGEVL